MVKPLQYNSSLSLEEAEERIKEVKEGFENVKSHYSGLITQFKRKMKEEIA